MTDAVRELMWVQSVLGVLRLGSTSSSSVHVNAKRSKLRTRHDGAQNSLTLDPMPNCSQIGDRFGWRSGSGPQQKRLTTSTCDITTSAKSLLAAECESSRCPA